MKITLSNSQLTKTRDMLTGMELAGAESRYRTRLLKLINAAINDCSEDEQALLAEYVKTDEQGELVTTGDGDYQLKDGKTSADYFQAHKLFMSEKAVIKGGTIEGLCGKMVTILQDWDKPLSGDEADTYDELLTALEDGED